MQSFEIIPGQTVAAKRLPCKWSFPMSLLDSLLSVSLG